MASSTRRSAPCRCSWSRSAARATSPPISRYSTDGVGGLRRVRAPVHEPVDVVLGVRAKAEPAIQPLRRIEFFHRDADFLADSARLGEQRLDQGGADAAAAPLRQQRDVDDEQRSLLAVDIEPAGRRTMLLDDVEGGVGVMVEVMMALQRELALQEGDLLGIGPIDGRRNLVPAGRNIQLAEERQVGLGLGPQRKTL